MTKDTKMGNKTKNQVSSRRKAVAVIAIVLVLALALAFVLSTLTMFSGAENSSTIKKKINNLQSESNALKEKMTALEKEISGKKSKSQSTIEEKAQIDQKMEITRLEIQNTNDQIKEYSNLLAEKQAELDEGLRKQAELNIQYKERIRSMEETGKTSYWAILFKATSFANLLDRIDMIREIYSSDLLMMEQIKANNDEITETRKELEKERTALEQKVKELDDLQKTLEKQKQDAEALIIRLSEELAELNGSYEKLEAEEAAIRSKLLAEEQRYQNALSQEQKSQLARDNAGNAAGGGSGFICPVPVGCSRVTDAYGYRTHPIYGYYSLHSGVDLACAHGTPVYAIASGNVNISSYSSVNGNYVSISHGNGYGSLYAHLDYATVSSGDYVKQGQVIGYVGSTGWSTGPHLHFEIHLNGSTVNPMSYISN